MPKSLWAGKAEIAKWIHCTFPDTTTPILDVGVGSGTYGRLLHGYNLEAIEWWKPYVDEFGLREFYKHIYHEDMRTFAYTRKPYQLIIYGDVLEHMPVKEAQDMLQRAIDSGACVLVSVPFLWPKATKGLPGDAHIQDGITRAVMSERYPQLNPLYIYRAINGVEKYAYYIYLTEEKINEGTFCIPSNRKRWRYY